jgi:hypothetical protein
MAAEDAGAGGSAHQLVDGGGGGPLAQEGARGWPRRLAPTGPDWPRLAQVGREDMDTLGMPSQRLCPNACAPTPVPQRLCARAQGIVLRLALALLLHLSQGGLTHVKVD